MTVTFVLAIISIVLFVILSVWVFKDGTHIQRFLKSILVTLIATCLLALPFSLTTIATGEVGIKTSFGKIVGTNLKEGIQLKTPWQKITKMNIKVQKFTNESPMETSTSDMQMVKNVFISVNYKLNEDKVVDMYRSVGKNYESIVLEPAIHESIKGAISNYKAEEIVNKRTEVSKMIEETLKTKVQNYGIDVLDISLKNFDFSEEYNDSIEKKTIAEQNALRAKEELEITKAEAEKKRIEAEAEAEANRIKQSTLTDKVLYQMWLQKWDGKLPLVSGEDSFMIDLDSVLGK